jgi:hypothetical protein
MNSGMNFSRQDAQKAPKGNSSFGLQSLPIAHVCEDSRTDGDAVINAKARRRKGAESSFLSCDFATLRLCVEKSSLSVKSVKSVVQISNPQSAIRNCPKVFGQTQSNIVKPGQTKSKPVKPVVLFGSIVAGLASNEMLNK